MPNLNEVPFSTYGSYISLSKVKNSLFLNSLHGKSKDLKTSLKIKFFQNDTEIFPKFEHYFDHIKFSGPNFKGIIAFEDTDTLVIEATGDNFAIYIDSLPKYNFEYSFKMLQQRKTFYILNSYKNLTKYQVIPVQAKHELYQNLNVHNNGSDKESNNISEVHLSPVNQTLQFRIEEIHHHSLKPNFDHFDISKIMESNRLDFHDFNNEVNSCHNNQTTKEAAYILYSSFVKPMDMLHDVAIYASNNNFTSMYTWDHCFAALGLISHSSFDVPFNQMVLPYSFQSVEGQLPGSFSDSTIRWNFSKPPVQPYFIKLLLDKYNYPRNKNIDYEKLGSNLIKQYYFYKNLKSSNQKYVYEYLHGNDSGMDNSTVFKNYTPVHTPDLITYQILNLELLGTLQDKNLISTNLAIEEEIEKHLFSLMNYHYKNNEFVSKDLDDNIIESKSILNFLPILVHKHLPLEAKNVLISKIKNEYLTHWGITSEATNSPYFSEDSYWRGPIWAPTTFLIYNGIKEIDEALANEIKNRFIHLIEKSGFYENFNPINGNGLRGTAFTWTAGVYLYFKNN
ncbi:hypothetical protein MUA19_00620 [Staphylococcus chromogenes]|uniref:MGH1-like glycoside hydrolase domain-containing protein n=1 Tax=Staphylococcus chromogenes TaxID=46126 RepID=UPI0021D294C7|nr:hypothetical protein [Staphylococcus chromogenes]UXS67972.1 hypothetical protein MUA19_00620 [Staphylococcus chromogenes]